MPKILLVEDNEMNRDMLTRRLRMRLGLSSFRLYALCAKAFPRFSDAMKA